MFLLNIKYSMIIDSMKTWMCAIILALSTGASAQNPVISGQYSADPTARVFNGKMYLYPSHDIQSPIEKLKEWFCMADYHVFSSTNLTEWKDHGVIVSQDKVPWVQDGSYTMWAPDCVEKGGKYYFYFPAAPKGVEKGSMLLRAFMISMYLCRVEPM